MRIKDMGNPITVKVSVTEVCKNTYEIRAIMKGQFYKRLFVGYSRKQALKLFENWLNEQL